MTFWTTRETNTEEHCLWLAHFFSLSRLLLNEIFGSFFFLDKWNCTFFPLRKRNRLTVSFDWKFRMPVGRPGLGTYQQENGGWTSCRARGFIGRLAKLFFGRERRQFHLFGCYSIHISSGKSAISIHSVFPRCSSEARWKPESCK